MNSEQRQALGRAIGSLAVIIVCLDDLDARITRLEQKPISPVDPSPTPDWDAFKKIVDDALAARKKEQERSVEGRRETVFGTLAAPQDECCDWPEDGNATR